VLHKFYSVIRGAPDPELSVPVGSGFTPDLETLDPAGSGSGPEPETGDRRKAFVSSQFKAFGLAFSFHV